MTIMEQKINIAEILKDAPKGTKLYSPIFGEIPLAKVSEDKERIYCNINMIFQENGPIAIFNKYGQLLLKPANASAPTKEVMLFPSIHHSTWRDFSPSWKHKHFEPYQKVLVASSISNKWETDMYRCYDVRRNMHLCMHYSTVEDSYIIPYEGNENMLGKEVSNVG